MKKLKLIVAILALSGLLSMAFLSESFADGSVSVTVSAIFNILNITLYNTTPTGTEIDWETDMAAMSQVFWDVAYHESVSDYTCFTSISTAPALYHSKTLFDLNPGTLYHYRVKSTAIAGETELTVISEDLVFQTLPASAMIITYIGDKITSDGFTLVGVDAFGPEDRFKVSIPAGTCGLSRSGYPLLEIALASVVNPHDPPHYSQSVALAFHFGPFGAVFDRQLAITLSYDPANLASDIDESALYIAWWDASGRQWVALPGTVDTTNRTITAQVTQSAVFTVFQLSRPGDLIPGSPDKPPSSTIASFDRATPVSTAKVPVNTAPLNQLLMGIIIFLVVVNIGLVFLVFIFAHRRKKR